MQNSRVFGEEKFERNPITRMAGSQCYRRHNRNVKDPIERLVQQPTNGPFISRLFTEKTSRMHVNSLHPLCIISAHPCYNISLDGNLPGNVNFNPALRRSHGCQLSRITKIITSSFFHIRVIVHNRDYYRWIVLR